jgi:Cu/Ag efflux protein CusF
MNTFTDFLKLITIQAFVNRPIKSCLWLACLTLAMAMAPTVAMAQHQHGGHGDATTAEPGGTDVAKIYSTEGVVVELDPANRRMVVNHGPVPQVGWEAMTMGFMVEDPSLLNGLEVGDKIRFDILFQGQDYRVVDLEKL